MTEQARSAREQAWWLPAGPAGGVLSCGAAEVAFCTWASMTAPTSEAFSSPCCETARTTAACSGPTASTPIEKPPAVWPPFCRLIA
ncbi:hypothetical protein BJF82_10840 [Kytococcus sp. CUA-901]|nr:hypothetical protein BJF82_10840 [Kytococcus sp. CUA-901]